MYSRSVSGDIRARPRHDLQENDPNVVEEWREPEVALSGMQVAPALMGTTRRVLWWLLAVSVIFFLTALGIFGYYFTLGSGSLPANPSNVDIVVTGPAQIAGGEATELQIAVTNRNRIALQLSELVITFPEGTRKVTDYESDLLTLRQALGDLESGDRRQGTVSAVFAGSAGDRKTVNVALEYRVEGSNSIFVAESEYTIVFSSSPISVSTEGNAETVSGQPVEFTVNVASNSSAPVKDVLLDIDYPFGFQFVRSRPSPAAAGFWELGDLVPGEKKVVVIEGVMTGEEGDDRIFHITSGSRSGATSTAISTRLASNTYNMKIAQPFLGLAVLINNRGEHATSTNSSDIFVDTKSQPTIVASSESVTIRLDYQNNLDSEIADAIVVARLSGIHIDGAQVYATDGFYRSSDDSVLWDKNTTGGRLGRIAPGEKGSLTFTFTVPSTEDLRAVRDPQLSLVISSAGKRVSEAGVPQSLQSTAQRTIRVATDVGLTTCALYYSNPFGSTGPMPPKAGEETKYGLVFTLTNTTNKITDAEITAALPNYVRWVGAYAPSWEKLSFNQQTGTFTWAVGNIEAGTGITGSSVAARQLAIAIGLTPSSSQIGEQPALVNSVTLRGTDAAGRKIERIVKPDVTTNLTQSGNLSEAGRAGALSTCVDPGFSPGNASVVR